METIPSPSAFLSSPSTQSQSLGPSSTAMKNKTTTSKKPSSATKAPAGVMKPKQSKSRNGCITCKAKRLKCDETKPSCQQCHRRNVTCGGYRKDFKWRPFEEATFTNKAAPSQAKRSPLIKTKVQDTGPRQTSTTSNALSSPARSVPAERTMQENLSKPKPQPPPVLQMPGLDSSHLNILPAPFDMGATQYLQHPISSRSFDADSVTSPLESLFEDTNVNTTGRSSQSGQSPRLIDLLLPGSELNARRADQVSTPISPMQRPGQLKSEFPNEFPIETDDDDVEEIIREPKSTMYDPWMSQMSPQVYSANSMCESPVDVRDSSWYRFYRQPEVQAGSPEMLMLRFDKQTCGILSVKDGPTENPWRTLIWPLARESPALYHAIASMTAFHTAKEKPALRVDGMEHMRRSIRSLAIGLGKMRTDAALATTLALAFSESWDQHISTGIEHLRGARILVNQALVKHSRRPLEGDDLARLKFLCNTWIYMDVIARLTSVDDDDITDFNNILLPLHGPFLNQSVEIDPLMGCATTLFPLVARAANLCRKVRTMKTNSIAIISQANELKEQIERWEAGTDFEVPEDPSAEVHHALQTAEAYRYATLLYLHQAVPEIPSLTCAELAQKTLVFLATVPLSSRLVIVQIYPLLAAGCEAFGSEDRQWVEDRWLAMSQRMWIGNIDKCLVVTKEVWNRRDIAEATRNTTTMTQRLSATMYSDSSKRKFEDIFSFSDVLNDGSFTASKRPRTMTSAMQPVLADGRNETMDSLREDLNPERTVRGSLHWVGVMKEWQWEVLLG